MPIRTLHLGLGPIGIAVAKQIAARKNFKIVGAVDIDPAKTGRDFGEFLGSERKLRVPVAPDLTATIERTKPDVVVLCTSSALARVLPAVEEILAQKVAIISTTEEMAYPVGPNRKIARRIDALAREAGVAVLGTGVNPGFAMDALPLSLTAVCESVEKIEVDRVQDARSRRLPFQQKIGAGLSPEEFEEKVQSGGVRHVGLAESVSMIAAALGWKLDRITDEISPKVVSRTVSSEFMTVKKNQVSGLIQDGIGYRNGEPVIILHMEAYLGAPRSFERVKIHGNPPIEMTIDGGIAGDVATASMVVNAIPKLLTAPAGFRTMRDMPLPSYSSGALEKGL